VSLLDERIEGLCPALETRPRQGRGADSLCLWSAGQLRVFIDNGIFVDASSFRGWSRVRVRVLVCCVFVCSCVGGGEADEDRGGGEGARCVRNELELERERES
jgi:hypothetical protein